MDGITIADVFPLPGSTDKCKPPRHDSRIAAVWVTFFSSVSRHDTIRVAAVWVAFFSRVPAISSSTGLLKWGVGATRTDYALVGGANGMTLTPPHFLDSVRPNAPSSG